MLLSILKKIIPSWFFAPFAPFYHRTLALLSALLYGFPSSRIKVIGVTGTDGKSTSVRLIGAVLESAGFRVAWSSSIDFKIGNKIEKNVTGLQTMPGRFFLQRFLRRVVREKCHYAIIEVTSEGIVQWRHRFIEFDVVLLTNITPEHIEHHGSFEAYRQAKLELFKHLTCYRSKPGPKVLVVNLDDPSAPLFLSQPADERWGYALGERVDFRGVRIVAPKNVRLSLSGSQFVYGNDLIHLSLPGEFNVSNALAALSVGLSQNVPLRAIKKGLESVKSVPGRLEFINAGQSFLVVVDYALTPAALEKLYKLFAGSRKLICVFGAAGGGRDRWKRPVLGEIAARHCRYVILTTDDVHDDDPQEMIEDIAKGIKRTKGQKIPLKSYEKCIDRREAIRRALTVAKKNDAVLITGMGSEPFMFGPRGSKVSWDDRQVAREELARLGYDRGS